MNFVTGGTGLVGAYLLKELILRNEPVKALRRSSSSLNVPKNVFQAYLGEDWQQYFDKIQWVEGDILDPISLEEAIAGVDYVYHSAGYVSYQPEDNQKLFDINQKGTGNIVNACLSTKVRKMLYVSSIAALDKPIEGNIHREDIITKASKNTSNYGKSKQLGEMEVWRGFEEGLNMVIINPSIIFGYGNPDKGSTKLFRKIYNGLKFYTPGTSGFVDVKDVVEIMIQLMESDISGKRFIVNSENLSFEKAFHIIAEAFNKPAPKWKATPLMSEIYWRLEWVKSKLTGQQAIVTRETARAGQRDNFYSNQKIRETLGYEFIPIEKTAKEIASFLKKDFS